MTDEHAHDHDAHDHDHDHDHEHEHGHDHHEHVPVSYVEAVEGFREDKDDFYANDPRSPIPLAERAAFSGLPYYPVDETLVFESRTLEPYTGDEPSDFQIPTSDGQLRPAHRAGVLHFEIGGATYQLTAYTFDGGEEDGAIFVPFLDQTSGTETYGAGRYLDIDPELDGTYELDFNLAYHPSCVYDPRYSCPLTPAENRLPVRIEAGERLAPEA
jgi:uncharacterized protein (DUF1684 family)